VISRVSKKHDGGQIRLPDHLGFTRQIQEFPPQLDGIFFIHVGSNSLPRPEACNVQAPESTRFFA
jgi:hypothetical protein